MNGLRHWVAVTSAVLSLALLAGQDAQAEPTIAGLSLRGLQTGATTRLTIDGDQLGAETRVLLPIPVSGQQVEGTPTPKQITLLVTLPADAPGGIYPLRVSNPQGISAAVLVAVDSLPQRAAVEKLDSLPAALHGNLGGTARVRASFAGKKGQRIVLDVEAHRLGSKLNPVVRLYDSRNVQLAWSGERPSADGDARIDVALPEDGQYTAELHDVLFRGAQPGHYRLKIGEFRYADLTFPLAVQRGAQATLEAIDTNLAPEVKATVQAVGNGTAPLKLPAGAELCGAHPAVIISDLTEFTEGAQATGPAEVSAPPVGINGRLSVAGEEDLFRLPVTPGTRLQFELTAARIGSPLDAILSVRNEQNGELAASDDRPNTVDPGLDFTVPAGVSVLHLSVKDIAGRGGRDYIYRLTIEPADRPNVTVTAMADRLLVPHGGTIVLPLLAERRGYNGPIKLELAGLPAGVTVAGTEIPAGATQALLSLTAKDPASLAVLGKLTATGTEAQPPLPVLIRLGSDAAVPLWLRDQFAVAVVPAQPLAVAWQDVPAESQLQLGRTQPLQVSLVRGAGGEGPVRLSLLTSQVIPKKTIKQDNKDVAVDDTAKALRLAEMPTLPAEVNAAALTLLIPPDLPALPYDLAVKAERMSADNKTVLSSSVTPVLRWRAVAPPTEQPLTLLEDETDKVAALNQGTGAAELFSEAKYSGTASVKVTGQQRFNPTLPGVAVKIKEFPAAGEYRFVRFAWKKQGGDAVAIQLAHDGKFGPEKADAPTFRYHAGKAEKVFDGSLRVSDATPAEWTVVTRDLFADFGEFTLTGLSLSPIDGEFALFDHLYLGRSPGDLNLVAPPKP